MNNLEAVQTVIDMLYDRRDENEVGSDLYNHYNDMLISMLNFENEISE